MRIGTIGAGRVATMFARHAIAAGHDVIVSNGRGPETLHETVAALGARARPGTVAEAAVADLVLLAVPWWKVEEVARNLPPFEGRILVDATNAFASYSPFRIADLSGQVSSQIVAALVPGARVVKAFNTAPVEVFERDPRVSGGYTVVFLSGDDSAAKRQVGEIAEGAGFATVDLGDLATGGRLQQLGGAIAGRHFAVMGTR